MLLHSRDETLSCPECGDEFSTLIQLRRHQSDEHNLDADADENDGGHRNDSRIYRDSAPIDVTVQLVNNLENQMDGKETSMEGGANNGAVISGCPIV